MQRVAKVGGGQVQGESTWLLVDRTVIELRSTVIDGDRLITPAGPTGAAQCQVPLNTAPDNKLDWESYTGEDRARETEKKKVKKKM